MPSPWSLVAFTLLVQSAAGCVWCMQIALAVGIGPAGLEYRLLAALGAVLAGLAAAMAHLGNPAAGSQAVRNLKSSWLSREVFMVSLLAGILAALSALDQVRPGALNGWGMLAASLAAGVALYAMTNVYRLRTVPSWNRAATPLNYLGSALLLGGLLFTLAGSLQPVAGPASHLGFIAALTGFIFKAMAAAGKPPPGEDAAGRLVIWWPVLEGLGGACWALFMLSAGGPGLKPILLCLAAMCLTTGEAMHRVRFYNIYHRVGL